MRKLVFTPLFFLFFLQFAVAQDLPPNPEPGKCYVRCIKPDVWEDKEIKVLVKPAYKKLEVVPAEYKTVDEQILIKPASKKYVYVPAEFKKVTEEIQVEDPYNQITINPAEFEDSSEEVEVRPAYAKYEYQMSLENCDSDDPRNCMVMCYVEYPAETTSIPTEVLKRDANTEKTSKGGKTVSIKKEVLVSEARIDEIDIPAEYKTITKRVLVKDETVREVEVPAEYRNETVRVLKEKGGDAVWEEIDCKLTSYNVLPIYYELGSARLTPDSKRIIDEKLLALMKEKSLIRVELNSHTDSRGSASSNMDLSQRRAESVVNYLVSKGISRDRLVAKGYGETRLVNRCKDGVQCSEQEHQQNRRTEFRVLSN
jgi:OOP family OmpA-OmpF porin